MQYAGPTEVNFMKIVHRPCYQYCLAQLIWIFYESSELWNFSFHTTETSVVILMLYLYGY
jgi:hypothetical protein